MSTHGDKQNDNLLLVTFSLGEGIFGINSKLVQEVVKTSALTPVHHAQDYVLGIRNLRGRVVTVLDLRVRLNLGTSPTAAENRVLIIDNQGEPIGLRVDKIADTISVNTEDIEPVPHNLHVLQQVNLLGVCRQNERLVAILDINHVLQINALND